VQALQSTQSLHTHARTSPCPPQKLQLADGIEAAREQRVQRATAEKLALQVELLQGAFSTLADAVLEELGECRRACWTVRHCTHPAGRQEEGWWAAA
jgi:hypothetical protein